MADVATRLDPQEIYDLLREIVDARGRDYVYQKEVGGLCSYVNRDGKPDCLIAHLLVRLGVDPIRLSMLEGNSAHAVVPNVLGIDEYLNRAVVGGLNEAQRAQDSGLTWGDALEHYRSQVTFYGVTVS